jgi:hypothetical protein
MIKWMDDCLAVTDLCAGAGAHFTIDEWMALEFNLCDQVAWNLRYFCFSTSSSEPAVPKCAPRAEVLTNENCEPSRHIHRGTQHSTAATAVMKHNDVSAVEIRLGEMKKAAARLQQLAISELHGQGKDKQEKERAGLYTSIRSTYRSAFATCMGDSGTDALPLSPFI